MDTATPRVPYNFKDLHIALSNRVQTMSDGNNRTIFEMSSNSLLNQGIGFRIDGRSGLVQDDNL